MQDWDYEPMNDVEARQPEAEAPAPLDAIEDERDAVKRWFELGYEPFPLESKTLWVCPVDSIPVVDPDVHQGFHAHMVPLHVPAPFALAPEGSERLCAMKADDPDTMFGEPVSAIVDVDGVRSAVIGYDGETVPVRDLVPGGGRDSIYRHIAMVTRTGFYAPDDY